MPCPDTPSGVVTPPELCEQIARSAGDYPVALGAQLTALAWGIPPHQVDALLALVRAVADWGAEQEAARLECRQARFLAHVPATFAAIWRHLEMPPGTCPTCQVHPLSPPAKPARVVSGGYLGSQGGDAGNRAMIAPSTGPTPRPWWVFWRRGRGTTG
jgi:hypothetical protein